MKAVRLISSLVDDFNDGAVDPTKWPDSFGIYSEPGGRARVTCDTGFNAYSSGTVYTLAGSAVYLRVYPPAAGGSTGEAWTQVLVKADVSGTDIAFEVDAVNGLLKFMSRTGFFDPSTVAVTYSPVAHASAASARAAATSSGRPALTPRPGRCSGPSPPRPG